VHTFARLRGFGLTIIPFAPFVVRRIGDGLDDRVAIEHEGDLHVLNPRDRPIPDEISHVATVETGVAHDPWVIDFGRFSVGWPNQFALASSDLSGVPFELWGENGAAIFVQGPFDPVPTDEQFVAPGQRVTQRGTSGVIRWIEVGYDVDGVAWTQRLLVLPGGFVVTAQATASDNSSVLPVAGQLASEIAQQLGSGRLDRSV